MTRPAGLAPASGLPRGAMGAAQPMHLAPAPPTWMPAMRALVLVVLCALGTAVAAAQDTAIVIQPESAGIMVPPPELPHAVAEDAVRRYNAATTTRLVGRSRLPHGNEWRGDVAVRNGAVSVGGRIQGTLLVVNGDASIDSGATISGDLIVIGGTVTRAPGAAVAGEVRVYAAPLGYRTQGDEIALARVSPRRWLRSVGVEKSWGTADSRSSLTLATAGTFNRVEGLPVVFGPMFDWKLQENLRFRLDALGVFRTAGDLTDRRSDLGYLLRTELRSGEVPAYGAELRAYDAVVPVEDWGLHNAEIGWAAFLFQRDYRDYYLSKGLGGRVFVRPARLLRLSVEWRRDWQTSVAARDPWTLFRHDQPWRPNPPIDAGHYTTLSGTVTLDTRNNRTDPTAGWFMSAQLESSRSTDVSPQTGVPTTVRRPLPTDGSYKFTRAF